MADDPYAAFSSPVPQQAAAADPYASFSSPAQQPAQPINPDRPTNRANFFPHSLNELGSDIVGGTEGGLNAFTGGLAQLGGGLGYLGTLGATFDPEAAKAVQETINQKFTYQPRSQSGQDAAGNIGDVLQKIPQAADKAGGFVASATGSPALGAATNTGVQAIPMLVGGRGAARIGNRIIGGAEEALANYKPGLARTPEAQRMINSGVDLTPGQMKPGGLADAFEQLPTKAHVPVLGGVMADARANAVKTWQQSVAEKASAPGTKITATDINEMADQAQASFKPLYDQAKGVPVAPVIRKVTEANGSTTTETVPLRSAFADAIKDKNIQADPATRNSTGVWLMNKLGSLQKKPGAQALDSGQLIDLRSDIRAQIRNNARARDASKNDSAQLLQGAEQAVTDALESQLPPAALNILRQADAKYGDYKTFESAVLKAKDNPNGFSPEQLSQAIKESTTAGAYAKGGGRLRQVAKDAKAVFSSNIPATGAIVPAVGGMVALAATHPAIAAPLAAAGTLLAATKAGRRFAAGTTAAQMAAKKAATALAKKR